MARTTSRNTPTTPVERIVDVDVAEEMRGSFLEYAYSVIYSRALPDARDGLKPVQRRILYQMSQLGLRPDRGHVKCARVVGEVMGRLHPHGDSAIYDALVRMAQPFALRVPFVDGHGNFGSPDDGPAAMRYTECRLAPAAEAMTASLGEDVVDFVPNYDGREREPAVLPAAIPALLTNGASGIAVGMATNMAPHNLGEVCRAAALLLSRKRVSLSDVMEIMPGPDFPTGGKLLGTDGVRDAYATGRGSFRLRATTRIEQVTPRRQGIVVTELPFNVGPERVADRIRELVTAKKLDGIADLVDLTDGERGMRLVIEIKPGFAAEAVLHELYRLTPLEETFNVNSVALVAGQPKILGLLELLRVFVDHRLDVVRRRTAFRRDRAERRLHLVEGMLIAVLDIDEVVALIRSSEDVSAARRRLASVFDLTEAQANHILEMPLRRLTKFSQLELETEKADLRQEIDTLSSILDDEEVLRATVRDEILEVAGAHGTPRRTELVDAPTQPAPAMRKPPQSLRVADSPCVVELTIAGGFVRIPLDPRFPGIRPPAQVPLRCVVTTTSHAQLGLVTSRGTMHILPVIDVPEETPGVKVAPAPIGEYLSLEPGEAPVGLVLVGTDAPAIALGTSRGVVKRVMPDGPSTRTTWSLISLRPGDDVAAAIAAPDDTELIFVTSDAHLLRFDARLVRTQGRSGSGVAGVRLASGAEVVHFSAAQRDDIGGLTLVTVASSRSVLRGTGPCSVKAARLAEFPAKGRATAGVRCHRFVKGEDAVVAAWIAREVLAESSSGVPVSVPDPVRRDAGGTKVACGVAALGSA